MNDQQICFELNQLIERASACHEDFTMIEAKRIVKRVNFISCLVERLLLEAKTTMELSNIAENQQTKEQFEIYLHNLWEVSNYFANFIEYHPKTKTGYYMYVKDMINFAPQLNVIENKNRGHK